jgi:hypothetical protein
VHACMTGEVKEATMHACLRGEQVRLLTGRWRWKKITGGVEGEQHLSDLMEVDCVTTERGEGRCIRVRESQAGGALRKHAAGRRAGARGAGAVREMGGRMGAERLGHGRQ